MSIPNELASEFAKLVNGNDSKETERTVYGTVVLNSDGTHVRLDGSEILTPVSFTTNVVNGERVTVMIKDHQAIITGNITSPAARTQEVSAVNKRFDDYATTEEVNSKIEQSANGITTEVSQTLLQNYSTTTQMNSAISEATNEVAQAVDKKLSSYPTTTQMNSKVEQTAANVTSSVNKTLTDNYSTTEEMNSAIDQKADSIAASVKSTYATKDELGDIGDRVSEAEFKLTPSEIVATVTSSSIYQENIAEARDSAGQQMVLSFAQSNAIETERDTITIFVQVWKNNEDVTEQIPKQAFSWQRESGNDASDAEWNAREDHRGVTSITLTRDEIGKSCQIGCTLSESESLGYFTIQDGKLIFTTPDGYDDTQFFLQNGDLYGEDYYFIEDGKLKRNLVGGTMHATTNVFDHSVLETSHISIKDNAIDIGTGGNIRLAAGGTFTVDSGNFDVDADGNVEMNGTITSEAGKIGGWDIAPGALQSGEGTKHVRLSTEDATYGIWAGADAADDAPFRVGRDGSVYLTKLYVTDEEGNAQPNPVNLNRTYWKMDKAYARAVQSITVAGDTLTITLYDGTSVNFKKPSQAISLEGAWSGTTWTVTGQNDSDKKTISTTISANQSAWSAENKKQVMVYANNSPTYLIQMIVDASDVHAFGYNAGWNECIDNCVEDPGSYRITSQSPYELYVKNGDNYASVGSGWVKVAQTYGRYTIPQKKT